MLLRLASTPAAIVDVGIPRKTFSVLGYVLLCWGVLDAHDAHQKAVAEENSEFDRVHCYHGVHPHRSRISFYHCRLVPYFLCIH